MLKTLKWVYKLGYKHAESKYYHTLLKQINVEQPSDLDFFNAKEKDNQQLLQELHERKDRINELSWIVEKVFKSEVLISPEEPQTRNRFEP